MKAFWTLSYVCRDQLGIQKQLEQMYPEEWSHAMEVGKPAAEAWLELRISSMSAEAAILRCRTGPEPHFSPEACKEYMLTVLAIHKAGTNGSNPALGAALPAIGEACLEAMRTQRNREENVWHNIGKPAFFEAVASDQDFRGTLMKTFWTLSYVCRDQLGIQTQLEQMYPEEWSHAMEVGKPAAEARLELQISSMSAEAAILLCRTGPKPHSSPEACKDYMRAVLALHKAGTNGSNSALGAALPSIGKACLEAMRTQRNREKDVWHNICKPLFFEAVASDQDFRGTVMNAFWTLSYVCRMQLGIQTQLEQMYPEEWSHAMKVSKPPAEALPELQISSVSDWAAIRFCRTGPYPHSSPVACKKYMLTVLALHKAGTNGSNPALRAVLPSIGKLCLEAMHTQRNRGEHIWHNICKPLFFEAVANDQDFRGTVMKAFWNLSDVCRNQLGIQKQLEQMYPEEWSHAMKVSNTKAISPELSTDPVAMSQSTTLHSSIPAPSTTTVTTTPYAASTAQQSPNITGLPQDWAASYDSVGEIQFPIDAWFAEEELLENEVAEEESHPVDMRQGFEPDEVDILDLYLKPNL